MRSSAGRTSATGSSAGATSAGRRIGSSRALHREMLPRLAAACSASAARKRGASPCRRTMSAGLRAMALHQIARKIELAARGMDRQRAKQPARWHRRCRRAAASRRHRIAAVAPRMRGGQARSAPTTSAPHSFEVGQRRHRLVVEIERARVDQLEQASAAAGDSAPPCRAAPPRPDARRPRRGRSAQQHIAPPLQPDFARHRLARKLAHARHLEIEGIERVTARGDISAARTSVARKRSLSPARTRSAQ